MDNEKKAFIQQCESNYGISTAEFIEWFETAEGERSDTEKTWYRYANDKMTFSEFIEEKENKKLNEGVAAKLNELQQNGTLEATILLSGQIWLTNHYINYRNSEGE